MRALFDALSRLDYPKHKLDGVLLVEADDDIRPSTPSPRSASRHGCAS